MTRSMDSVRRAQLHEREAVNALWDSAGLARIAPHHVADGRLMAGAVLLFGRLKDAFGASSIEMPEGAGTAAEIPEVASKGETRRTRFRTHRARSSRTGAGREDRLLASKMPAGRRVSELVGPFQPWGRLGRLGEARAS